MKPPKPDSPTKKDRKQQLSLKHQKEALIRRQQDTGMRARDAEERGR
jgi:hypothetical protein